MIPRDCKRLAEVDFPIAVVSKHAAREKEARCGHIPKIHIWPAARPAASSRAVLLGLLLPDPCDPQCPEAFKEAARAALSEVRQPAMTDADLRNTLLWFIGSFASWDLAANATYLRVARGLVKAAHPEETPLVVDPFAGGGSIPLEALRLGCDAFASDLNPVACLILKVMLEDIPKHGPKLADELRRIGAEIKKQAEHELADLYPKDPDGATPIAYIWARTVRCESPNCGAEIPLVRSFWLAKKAKRRRSLKPSVVRAAGKPPSVEFEVFEPKSEKEVQGGTVSRAKATCLCCGVVLPPERVRGQLTTQRGGADVVFDAEGNRIGGARMLAVVTLKPGEQGRHYRLPTGTDYMPVRSAQARLSRILDEWERGGRQGLSPVPDEPTPAGGGSGAGRAFSVRRYGVLQWADLFTARQNVALAELARGIGASYSASPAGGLLTLCLGKIADMNNGLSTWQPHAEIPAHMLTRFAIPMKWDFSEAVPVSESSGTVDSAIKRSTEPLPVVSAVNHVGTHQLADATESPLPDDVASVWFTDPPYYDAVPYADLSDFFLVWLRRALPGNSLLRDPFDAKNPLAPKQREIVQDETKRDNGRAKDRAWFEETVGKAFAEGRRVLRENGVGSVVFAHKTTEGWEALLSGMVRGGWTITGSWPIATEMGSRLRARDSAALATSIHLVCRPRPKEAQVGDWGEVLRELPKRVGIWMERLQGEGVRGADLVFACIGPALEVFSRYSKVETAEGTPVGLPEFLGKVWEVVGREALAQVLGGGNGGNAAVEEDARLTALFLWTLQSTNGNGEAVKRAEPVEEEVSEEEDEEQVDRRKPKGLRLIYDVVRRFAQPLGIHLEEWEGRIIETEKGVVRLLPVGERAEQLFGKEGAHAVADQIESRGTGQLQLALFPQVAEVAAPPIRGSRRRGPADVRDESLRARREATTLDRVHAAMLLQKSGRANALRALLRDEVQRGPEFLRLANGLSALYPRENEEKRLLDAMLLAVPR